MKRAAVVSSNADTEAYLGERLGGEPVLYTLSSGANTIKHGQKQQPKGRIIVYQTVTVLDTGLTKETWSLTASAAGTVKVIWI